MKEERNRRLIPFIDEGEEKKMGRRRKVEEYNI
jgi:hypothetical protein